MSEEGKKDFFEWKDEIESKYNDLSESRIRCENKIEALEKKQKHDFNKLLWIKMIPYKEWFWGLKMFVEEQIAVIIKKLTWLSNENAKLYTQIDDDALKRAKLEEVLRELGKRLEKWFIASCEKYIVGDIPRLLKKLDSPKQTEKKERCEFCGGDSVVIDADGETIDCTHCDGTGVAKAWGGEKEEEISVVADEDSPRLFPKDTDHLDSKLPEPIKACFNCKSLTDISGCDDGDIKSFREFMYTTFKTGICNNYRSIGEPKTEPEKELYELYLKEKGECYFRKITHPFTEYNNMVHRGIGQKLVEMNYDIEERVRDATRKEQIAAFLSKKILIPFIAKIIEKETNEEYCSSEIIAELIHNKLKEKWEESLK